MTTLPYELKTQTIIGKNLRKLRESRGLTQKSLADALGITFQQVQKYEKGRSSIPAARLYAMSQILDASFDKFFIGISKQRMAAPIPPALPSVIMARAQRLQRDCTPQKRAEILKIIDMLLL